MSFTKEVESKNSHKTINVVCERLFKDCYADVRSYLVEKAKASGKTLTIQVPNKGFRVFQPEDGHVIVKKEFRSKRGTEPYHLVSFFWSDEGTKPKATPQKVEAPQFEFSF
jgi:hypothetical protein